MSAVDYLIAFVGVLVYTCNNFLKIKYEQLYSPCLCRQHYCSCWLHLVFLFFYFVGLCRLKLEILAAPQTGN